jgi:PAS domain S-box-containing protein
MPTTPLQLLMIEDNEDDALFTTRELRRAGYEVHGERVATEEELRAALPRRVWDLILCDFTLPGFGGAQALALAKRLVPDVPFIFVSGTIGEEAVAEAMRSGAQDYVMKDRLKRLVPAVARELREAAMRREARQADLFLRESEHKYRQLFDALHEAIFVIEPRSGRIIDTNRQAEARLGLPRAGIVGVDCEGLLASPSGGVVMEELRELAADPARSGCALLIPRRDGPPLRVHASASPLELHGRRFLLVLAHERADSREHGPGDGPPVDTERITATAAGWPEAELTDLIARLERLRPGRGEETRTPLA